MAIGHTPASKATVFGTHHDPFGLNPRPSAFPEGAEKAYLDELNQQIEVMKEAILKSDAKTLDEYKWMTGQYRGLMVAKQRFEDVLDRFTRSLG